MNFTEAIECLKNGKRVRSVLWERSYFIELIDGEYGKCISQVCNDVDRGVRWPPQTTEDYKPAFSFKDVTNEWELYEDELMPLIEY